MGPIVRDALKLLLGEALNEGQFLSVLLLVNSFASKGLQDLLPAEKHLCLDRIKLSLRVYQVDKGTADVIYTRALQLLGLLQEPPASAMTTAALRGRSAGV